MAAADPSAPGMDALKALETAIAELGPQRGKFKNQLARVASYAKVIDGFLCRAEVSALKFYLPVLQSAGLTWCRPIRAQLSGWATRLMDMQAIVGSCPPSMTFTSSMQRSKKRQRECVPVVRSLGLARADVHQYFSSLPAHERSLDGLVAKPLLSGPLARALLREPISDVELLATIWTQFVLKLAAKKPLDSAIREFTAGNKPRGYSDTGTHIYRLLLIEIGDLLDGETATRVDIINFNFPSLLKSATQCANYLSKRSRTCPDFLKPSLTGHMFLRNAPLKHCFFCRGSRLDCIALTAQRELELMENTVCQQHITERATLQRQRTDRRGVQPPGLSDQCAAALVRHAVTIKLTYRRFVRLQWTMPLCGWLRAFLLLLPIRGCLALKTYRISFDRCRVRHHHRYNA